MSMQNKKIKNYFIFLIVGAAFFIAPHLSFASVTVPGLTHLYPLDGSASDTVGTADASFCSYTTGNYCGNTTPSFITGIFNQAGELFNPNSVPSYWTFPQANSDADNFISFWVNVGSTPGGFNMFEGTTVHGAFYLCGGGGGNLTFDCSAQQTGSTHNLGINIDDGNWHNIIFTDNTEFTIIVDGNIVYSNPDLTIMPGDGAVTVGVSGGSTFGGAVDDLGFSVDSQTSSTIASIWNGGTGNNIIPGGGGGGTSTLMFNYPGNGSSTGLFSPYQLSLSNPVSSTLYTIRVGSTICTSFGIGCAPTFFANNGLVSGGQIAAQGIQVPFSPNSDYQNNVAVNSVATAFDQLGNIVATTSINWTLLSIPSSSPSSTLSSGGVFIITSSTGNGTFTTATTTGNAAVLTQYNTTSTAATASDSCPPPSNAVFGFFTGQDEYYAFCSTLNLLFVPGPIADSEITGSVSSLETVPPYSWFFQVNTAVQAAAANTSSTSPGISFTWKPGFNIATTTLTVLRADPTSDPNLTEITPYSPYSLIALIWNAFLVGVILLIVVGFYKLMI
jgi:hypothetical protein